MLVELYFRVIRATLFKRVGFASVAVGRGYCGRSTYERLRVGRFTCAQGWMYKRRI